MGNNDILDFAILESTGQLVDIREVVRGRQCKCICPSCKRGMVARKGPIRRHHFSHHPQDQQYAPCSGGPETGLHLAARQLIHNWSSITLQALQVTVRQQGRFGQERTASRSIPGYVFPVENSVLPDDESWIGDWKPDVVLSGTKGEVRVEIKVTSGITDEKRSKIDRDRVATIEYDLSHFRPSDAWTLASLDDALRTDQSLVRWVFHPERAELQQRLSRELQDLASHTMDTNGPSTPTFVNGDMVFHPSFGLVPANLEERDRFILQTFLKPESLSMSGAVMKIRKHAVLNDAWMVSFFDSTGSRPKASLYDSLFSEYLARRGLHSTYIGQVNVRIVHGTSTTAPMLGFVAENS